MSALSDISARVARVHLTRRAALAAALPVPVVAFLPGSLGPLVAGVWMLLWFALVLSDVRRSGDVGRLSVERELPVKLSIGVPNPVRLTLRNPGAHPVHVHGRETPPPGFEGGRTFGPIVIPAYGETGVSLSFVPPERGSYEFGDVGLRVVGPAGLAGRQRTIALAAEARVYPDITAVHRYALLARKGALHEIGVRRARLQGVGTEFESLRDYEPGDDYRDIDWKATARRGAPVVRHFEAERSQTVIIALDAGRLMNARVGMLSKLDRAINASLLLAFLATRGGDNVGLLVFGRDVRAFVPPRRGHRQFLTILEALYAVEGRVEEPDYALALRYLTARVSKRSLVVLFSELVGTEPSRRLLGVMGALAPRHLPLMITQRNREVESVATRVPGSESDVYRAAVAQDLLHDKAQALAELRARGSLLLDVEPDKLTVASVNRYLEIKARGRL